MISLITKLPRVNLVDETNQRIEPSESLPAASFVSPFVLRFFAGALSVSLQTHPPFSAPIFSKDARHPRTSVRRFARVPSNDNERTKVQNLERSVPRGKDAKIFFFSFPSPHETRLRLGLNGKSKEYRFEMRRWVLTYPYPHPRPSDDLLGASYPNLDIRFADKQPLYQHAETLASPFCALCPLRLSLGGSERAPTLVRNVLSRPPSQKLIQGRHFNHRSTSPPFPPFSCPSIALFFPATVTSARTRT